MRQKELRKLVGATVEFNNPVDDRQAVAEVEKHFVGLRKELQQVRYTKTKLFIIGYEISESLQAGYFKEKKHVFEEVSLEAGLKFDTVMEMGSMLQENYTKFADALKDYLFALKGPDKVAIVAISYSLEKRFPSLKGHFKSVRTSKDVCLD